MAYENVILVVILMGTVFFGAKKLPELARSLGRAQTEYEKARIEAQREISRYNKDNEKDREDDDNHNNNNSNGNDTHASAVGSHSHITPTSDGARITTATKGDNNIHKANSPVASTKLSEVANSNDNNSSLVIAATTTAALTATDARTDEDDDDNDNKTIGRTRLQIAAKKIGIENPERLSDDELIDAIRNNLDL
jgi:sec-independent protein translocase protein TatA